MEERPTGMPLTPGPPNNSMEPPSLTCTAQRCAQRSAAHVSLRGLSADPPEEHRGHTAGQLRRIEWVRYPRAGRAAPPRGCFANLEAVRRRSVSP
jgi:hypothetical protein